MKTWLFTGLLLFTVTLMQAQDFVREIDRKTGQVLLHGKVGFKDLMKESTFQWLKTNSDAYEAHRSACDQLNKIAGDYRFIVFLGTWCSDTRDLLPKFHKILLESGIDEHAVEMYAVNRNKESLNLEHTFYNLQRVPTFIILHQHREVGRIIESVTSSLEEEISTIIAADYSRREQQRKMD